MVNSGEEGTLSQRPFREPLRGVRAARGKACVCCQREVDARLGPNLTDQGRNQKGYLTRPSLRQGWLCGECEEAKGKEYYSESWTLDQASGRYLKTVTVNRSLAVPTFSSEDIEELLSAGE